MPGCVLGQDPALGRQEWMTPGHRSGEKKEERLGMVWRGEGYKEKVIVLGLAGIW